MARGTQNDAMSEPSAVPLVLQDTEDQRWMAWRARGKAHGRLVNQRLLFVALVMACGLVGGWLVALVLA